MELKEKIRNKWNPATRARKIITIIFCVVLATFIFFSGWCLVKKIHELWESNRVAIIALPILILYLYPILYSNYLTIEEKNRELENIMKQKNKDDVEKELKEFEFYTFSYFLAEILKPLSSLLIFVFVQIMFTTVPEVKDIKAILTMQIYWGIILCSLMICFGFFMIFLCFSNGIIACGFSKNRHIEYMMKILNYQKG